MARDALKKIGLFVWPVITGAWFSLIQFSNWVGRSTVGDDFNQLWHEKLPAVFRWLFSTPWWVPAILMTVATGWLIYLNWPRRNAGHLPEPVSASSPSQSLATTSPAAPFADGLYVGRMDIFASSLRTECVCHVVVQ